jgi:hypothetical protein
VESTNVNNAPGLKLVYASICFTAVFKTVGTAAETPLFQRFQIFRIKQLFLNNHCSKCYDSSMKYNHFYGAQGMPTKSEKFDHYLGILFSRGCILTRLIFLQQEALHSTYNHFSVHWVLLAEGTATKSEAFGAKSVLQARC